MSTTADWNWRPPQSGLRDSTDATRLQNARDRLHGSALGRFLQPAPMLFSREGHNIFLGDVLRGRPAFLLCSGPSLISHDLSKLNQRGIVTMAVNNAAVVHRPQLWCSVDDPGNFCDAIWRDPSIWKFVPLAHMEKQFMVRDDSEQLVLSAEKVGDMPCVFGFRRNESFVAEQWLHEDTFNWGNHSEQLDAYGNKGSRSVMYVALRLLYYLGARRVYLLGCDFRMEVGKQNYAFPQERSRSSVRGNNSSYRILNDRLLQLKPYFAQEGFEVFNCTPESGLTVFPHVEFEDAVRDAARSVPAKIITAGMYDRQQREEDARKAAERQRTSVQSVPEVTLVVPVNHQTLGILEHTWLTWMRFKPDLERLPVCLAFEEGASDEIELPAPLARHPKIWRASTSAEQAELSSAGRKADLIRVTARAVETAWFLWLDPKVIATGRSEWISQAWFEPDQSGARPVLVGSCWTYAKPADRFEQLDDWGDGVPGLKEHPRLQIPLDRSADRLRYSTISGWCLFGDMRWLREIVPMLREHPPGPADATFLHYCAMRQGRSTVRVPFKQLGWDHSFGWSARETIRRCLPRG